MELTELELLKPVLLALKKYKILIINDNSFISLKPSAVLDTWVKDKGVYRFVASKCLTEEELVEILRLNLENISKKYSWIKPIKTDFEIDKAIEIVNEDLLLRLQAKKEVQNVGKN
ncbi:MAG: hypothetical protein H7263_12360 [Candidatus Sericytochromatia bacterium]|nr:hypothetical protein [Candidatus Sericytochromatia bacterium]